VRSVYDRPIHHLDDFIDTLRSLFHRADSVIARDLFPVDRPALAWVEVRFVAWPSTGSFSALAVAGVDIPHFRDMSQVCLGWLDLTTLEPELLDIRSLRGGLKSIPERARLPAMNPTCWLAARWLSMRPPWWMCF